MSGSGIFQLTLFFLPCELRTERFFFPVKRSFVAVLSVDRPPPFLFPVFAVASRREVRSAFF